MQIPLRSMQMRPKSQACLPSGPTIVTMIGLHWTPQTGLGIGASWSLFLLPEDQTDCFSPWGTLALPAGSGVLQRSWVGSGPLAVGLWKAMPLPTEI